MIKTKYLLLAGISTILMSCGGYTEEQGKAAEEFCDCMDKEGDFDILFYECDLELMESYDNEMFADEGWALALEEKCPTIAGEIADAE